MGPQRAPDACPLSAPSFHVDDPSGALEPHPIATLDSPPTQVGVFCIGEILFGPSPQFLQHAAADHQRRATHHGDILRGLVVELVPTPASPCRQAKDATNLAIE